MKFNLKEIISIANNVANPPDADKLKSCIYDLQKENIELDSKNKELMSELQIYQEWSNTKSLYKEYQTKYGCTVYVTREKNTIDVFYCPVCFDKKSIIPLQPTPNHIIRQFGERPENSFICPKCYSESKMLYKINT